VVCGCVGFVAEGRVHKLTCLPPLAKVRLAEDAPIPRVGMHTVTLDDDGHLLTLAAGAGYDGLVVEAFGAGHVPSAMVDELGRLASMMPVVLASRAGAGVIFRQTYAFPGSEMDLIGRGLIPAGWLDGRKSRVALSLLLAGGSTGEEISAFFRSCGG
jgi:L-asparaginase